MKGYRFIFLQFIDFLIKNYSDWLTNKQGGTVNRLFKNKSKIDKLYSKNTYILSLGS